MIIPDALKLFFRRLGCAEMDELFAFMFIEIAVYLILIFQRQIRAGDEMNIVIFSSALERSFEQLIGISGVGPKAALIWIRGTNSTREFCRTLWILLISSFEWESMCI